MSRRLSKQQYQQLLGGIATHIMIEQYPHRIAGPTTLFPITAKLNKVKYQSMIDDTYNSNLKNVHHKPIILELSLTNAVAIYQSKRSKTPHTLSYKEACHAIEIIKRQWLALPQIHGLMITNAPLFIDKISLCHDILLRSQPLKPKPPLSIIIGAKTFYEIFRQKYYGQRQYKYANFYMHLSRASEAFYLVFPYRQYMSLETFLTQSTTASRLSHIMTWFNTIDMSKDIKC